MSPRSAGARSRPPDRQAGIRFRRDELRDLGVAWLALGLAFTFFLYRPAAVRLAAAPGPATLVGFLEPFARSLLTVGLGFLLHELAHKVVAVRFGQVAEFRADYGMLGLAVAAGLAGFLFAAPGAVHHAGRLTERENGLIALAGPATNLGLAALFLPLALLAEPLAAVGNLGVAVNLLLAAFNLIPFGPLDGRKVLAWSPVVFGVTFLPSAALALSVFFG
ncbi:MAG: metalloprotease [Halobacteriales archaeon]